MSDALYWSMRIDSLEQQLRIERDKVQTLATLLTEPALQARFRTPPPPIEIHALDTPVVQAALGFVNAALDAHTSAQWWADADMQDALLAAGFLTPVEVTAACTNAACCCVEGDVCYRFSWLGQLARTLRRE